jgi:N-acyl-D-amino-acid deacylase
LLITNGLVIDGSGSPGYHAAVVVEGESLTIHRGDASQLTALRTIDANGLVVCPGFIDLHSHGGLTIFGAPRHEPKVRQGVTTELVGVDGISHAPFRSQEELRRYIWLDSGLNGYPPQPADWLTVADLLSRYDGRVAVNIAYILGNSPVRIWAAGWSDRPATVAELDDMRAITREAMEEGAWGLSTGLDYPPGAYAPTDELVALADVSGRLGGMYHTHTRGSLRARGPLAPFEEALEIGRLSGCPIHLTHFYQSGASSAGHAEYLELVENGRAEGMDVTFDCYTYPYSSTAATILLPNWAKDGGPERLISALTDGDERARMKEQMDVRGRPERWGQSWLTTFSRPENAQYSGRSIAEISEMRSQEPLDAFFDLLVEENLGISWVGLGPREQSLPRFVAHPYGMIASDAMLLGEHPSPRTYGCFPRVLGEFVRKERYLSLEEAIRKMTSFPAQRLGLPDRGLLRDGFRADVVVFDPETVGSPATRERPKQYPSGIEHVIVNGQLVIEGGEHTGALPGRALRRGHAST